MKNGTSGAPGTYLSTWSRVDESALSKTVCLYAARFCVSLHTRAGRCIGAQCGRTAVRRFISRSEESELYNRINRKSGAFPRKRIFVIYARRTGRSVKETGGAIARLKHYD